MYLKHNIVIPNPNPPTMENLSLFLCLLPFPACRICKHPYCFKKIKGTSIADSNCFISLYFSLVGRTWTSIQLHCSVLQSVRVNISVCAWFGYNMRAVFVKYRVLNT